MHSAKSETGKPRWLRSGEGRWTDPNREPALDEILSDPVIRAVMRRDGLDPCEVRRFMVETARRLDDDRHAGTTVPFPPAHGPEHRPCA